MMGEKIIAKQTEKEKMLAGEIYNANYDEKTYKRKNWS